MKRLAEEIVPLGLRMAWRRASWPTSRSPFSVKPTTEGVVRDPSALGITVGLPPSMAAITEFVVPRSMPTALAISSPSGLGEERHGVPVRRRLAADEIAHIPRPRRRRAPSPGNVAVQQAAYQGPRPGRVARPKDCAFTWGDHATRTATVGVSFDGHSWIEG